jgi:hypothetical protein
MTLFYTLPATLLEPGMSTDDGQDILEVNNCGKYVLYHVYTPRPDDEELDEENRCTPEGRMREPSELVNLATFDDTTVDGSTLPQATITKVEEEQ